MENKRGGKRKGAGRPNNNSVRKNITLPAHYVEFVEKNNLSLSKLAQQKIEEIMKIGTQNISGGNQLFQGNAKVGKLSKRYQKRLKQLDKEIKLKKQENNNNKS